MLRIVLIEDNPADAQVFESALQQTGLPVEITVLSDGMKALECFHPDSHHPARSCDLVVLDLNLPRVSGFEVLEEIRGFDGLRNLPILVMSGSKNPVDIDRCYRAGANSYICKPIHLDEMLSLASQVVTYWSVCVQLPPKRSVSSSDSALREALNIAV
jgi:CheY-like chemotaxis protein